MALGPAQTMRRYNTVYKNVGCGESTNNHPLVLSSKNQNALYKESTIFIYIINRYN